MNLKNIKHTATYRLILVVHTELAFYKLNQA
jgi:hypothetical protein